MHINKGYQSARKASTKSKIVKFDNQSSSSSIGRDSARQQALTASQAILAEPAESHASSFQRDDDLKRNTMAQVN